MREYKKGRILAVSSSSSSSFSSSSFLAPETRASLQPTPPSPSHSPAAFSSIPSHSVEVRHRKGGWVGGVEWRGGEGRRGEGRGEGGGEERGEVGGGEEEGREGMSVHGALARHVVNLLHIRCEGCSSSVWPLPELRRRFGSTGQTQPFRIDHLTRGRSATRRCSGVGRAGRVVFEAFCACTFNTYLHSSARHTFFRE